MSETLTGGTPQQFPGGIGDLLSGGAGSGQAQDAAPDQDPLAVLQDVIEKLPPLIAALPDPTDTHEAIKALHVLSGIQKRLMLQQGSGGPAPAAGR